MRRDVLVVLKELRASFQEIASLQPDLTATFETKVGCNEILRLDVVSKRNRCIESRFEALALRTSQWLETIGLPSCQPAVARWRRQHPVIFYAALIDVIPLHPAIHALTASMERWVLYEVEHAAVSFLEILITQAEDVSGRLPPDLISRARAAVIAEVDPTTIKRWIKKQKLPVYGPSGLVCESELMRLLPSLRERWSRAKGTKPRAQGKHCAGTSERKRT